MADLVGKTISHYRITELVGQGGMGVVYKAEDTKLKRTVALKFLPPEWTRDPEAKARFMHEAQAASALQHNNICTIHEIDETPTLIDPITNKESRGQMFICMDYYDGQSLQQLIHTPLIPPQGGAKGGVLPLRGDLKGGVSEARPLPLDDAINYAIQIAEGLNQAHQKTIVHRDLKPANVLVTDAGVAKIVDFGLAKLTGRTRLTKDDTTLGTVAYMSPEQAQAAEVDHRSDIWALGAILYEMISGRPPFAGDYEQAVMYAIMNEEPEPVTGLRTNVPLDLERIVGKCLAKKPEDRYQHADEFIVDLRQLGKMQELQATRTGTRVKSKRQKSKAGYFLLSGSILAALILALVGYRFFASKREARFERKMLVVLPFENLGPSEDEYFADGMTEELTSRLASVGGLGVISRTSAFHYAGTDKAIKQIGAELGVDYVLEGTVRWTQAGDKSRVRITPQLIQVSDDTHVWANTYDRVLDDIFEIQSEIAQQVVEQLGITLHPEGRSAVAVQPTKNLEAYQAYLRGRYYEGRPHFTMENWQRMIESYQQAVDLDPNFALAYAELAKAHSVLYYFQHDLSDKRLEMAKQAAERAIELAPESPQVHLVLSYYYLRAFRNPEQALKELEIAERGLQNNADVFRAKAYTFQLQGRFQEAGEAFEKAFKLSPRDADLPIELVFLYWPTRKYQRAVEAANQAIALAPNEGWPYIGKALCYWFWTGDLTTARAALEAAPTEHAWLPWMWFWQEIYEGKYRKALEGLSSTNGEWIKLKMWARPKSLLSAYVYELLDDPKLAHAAYETAKSMLEKEVREWPQDPRMHSSLGIAYAALGRKNEAIRQGKKAVELLPISKDAFYGVPYVQDLAHIYTIVGEDDAALEQIDYLLSIASWFSVPWLQLDPRWNRLRDHPEFQRLLKKYSGDS